MLPSSSDINEIEIPEQLSRNGTSWMPHRDLIPSNIGTLGHQRNTCGACFNDQGAYQTPQPWYNYSNYINGCDEGDQDIWINGQLILDSSR